MYNIFQDIINYTFTFSDAEGIILSGVVVLICLLTAIACDLITRMIINIFKH